MVFESITSEEGRHSEYNSAVLKMRRLDGIAIFLARIRNCLHEKDYENKCYFYETFLNTLISYYGEVGSQCSTTERIEVEKLLRELQWFVDNVQVYDLVNQIQYPYKTQEVLNKSKFIILRKKLFVTERLLNDLKDKHGMDTAYDEGGLF